MKEIISNQEAVKLMDLEGETRGISLKGEGDFVLKEEGEKGRAKLEEALKAAGYPLDFSEIRAMDFYPLGMEALILVSVKRLFNYDEAKLEEMGRFEPKISFLIRMFLKYFISPEIAIKEAPKIWRESYTVGDLKIVKFDKDQGEAVIRIYNFRLHPLQCYNLRGYFSSVAQMITGKRAEAEEPKCIFKGDDYHEFILNW